MAEGEEVLPEEVVGEEVAEEVVGEESPVGDPGDTLGIVVGEHVGTGDMLV